MEKLASKFEKAANKLDREVSAHLSKLLSLNAGKILITDEMKDVCDFGELLEFRNELTGSVFDFYPISILPDCQIEAYDTEYEPIKGDHVSMNQLPIDSKISLIRMLEEM
jgi:hypothetical protein